MNDLSLTISRAEAFRDACKERGPIAFVVVCPPDGAAGVVAALGVAVANERGFHPVSTGWARFSSWDAAEANADALNANLHGGDMERAAEIVFSTMGGKRFFA